MATPSAVFERLPATMTLSVAGPRRWGDAARRCVTWLLRIEVGVYEDEVGLVVRPRSTSAKRFNTALFDSSNPNRMNQVFIRELEARRVSA